MSKRTLVLICSIFLIVPLIFLGCSGDDGSNGINGTNGTNGTNGKDLTATAFPESCSVCHGSAGNEHQAFYDQLYQDNVIKVTDVTYSFADNTDTVTFIMKKGTAFFDCTKVQNLNIYFVQYTGTGFDNPDAARLALKGGVKNADNVVLGTLTGSASTGLCTSIKPSNDNVNHTVQNGLVIVYGYDERIGTIPGSRVQQVKFPYAAYLKKGTVDYVSAANVEGCEKCHTVPYLKHGNIYGRIGGDAATDMYTCKACHQDNGEGGHFIWQLLVDDTALAAFVHAGTSSTPNSEDADFMTDPQVAKYAYKTRLMNDVHMSHAMEFEYPQSMATCNTCHGGKLDRILTNENFVAETCKSCHAVTGSGTPEKPQKSLTDIWIEKNVAFHNDSMTCNSVTCHGGAPGVKTFSEIHSGYHNRIYASDGTRYSTTITFSIDNASFADNTNVLTFGFSGTGSKGALSAADAVPTVLIGLYGWDSKDYVVGPHESIPGSSPSKRNLEYSTSTNPVPTNNSPYITVTKTGSAWNVTADLSAWAGKISDNTVKRVEIAVMPRLEDPALPKTYNTSSTGVQTPTGDNVVALDAPSKTFNLKTKASETFFSPIVSVEKGCNNCHDALAVNFHTPDRGGNIVVCRLCHTVRSGGSHLEMQSRSIDSYAQSRIVAMSFCEPRSWTRVLSS